MELLAVALLGAAAYLIGAISPSFYLTHWLKRVDIRDIGSKNAGTLNTLQQLGPWWALLVLAFDVGKGAVAVLLPGWIGVPEWAIFVTAALVMVGHNWPVMLGFRGGKGAASLIGICFAVAPAASLIAAIPGLIAIALSRNGIIGLTVGFILVNLLLIGGWIFNVDRLTGENSWQPAGICLSLTLLVAIAYGLSIRGQLLEAFRQRSLRKVFFDS